MEKQLKLEEIAQITCEIVDPTLPIWVANLLDADRLDNCYYSVSYVEAERILNQIPFPKVQLENLINEIQPGLNPSDEGDIPILEGRNILPNYIFPNIEKYAEFDENRTLKENDILITKDGSPGITAVILQPLLNFLEHRVTAGEHVHIVRLHKNCQYLASFITLFLNSKIGQASLRRYVTGAISPSISATDLKLIRIPLPQDKGLFIKAKQELENLQEAAIRLMNPANISEAFLSGSGLAGSLTSYLPINWMPGGKRDAHGYYK